MMMNIQDYLSSELFEADIKKSVNTEGLLIDQNNDLWVNPCPWSDGSNLKINTIDTITSDPWNNYEIGIDYEGIQERISQAITEAFEKAGIPTEKGEPVKVEKYKMKHK